MTTPAPTAPAPTVAGLDQSGSSAGRWPSWRPPRPSAAPG